jgi:V/A-type H+-transporting ATPase subunit D
MSDEAPSRNLILEYREERRTMAEGHAFLEEKCLILAGEILRELAHLQALRREAQSIAARSAAALAGAIAYHGLEELSILPVPDLSGARLALERRSVMGVTVATAALVAENVEAPSAAWSSPEARSGREAIAELLIASTKLGATAGNLERLSEEYRKSICRERALDDVLIPEMDHRLADLETRLEDLEREDAIGMRLGR